MALQHWTGQGDSDVEAAVTWLQEVGLVGPAFLLLSGMRPVSFVGGQGLLFLQPLLPFGSWRSAAGRFANLLCDRSRLDSLLGLLEARLRSQEDTQGKEDV